MTVRDEGLRFIRATRDGDVLGEFTDAVINYRHEWREGPYKASWRFEVNDDPANPITTRALETWFENSTMSQVRVKHRGIEVWRGYIGKMIKNARGLTETKDVMAMTNAAKCSFFYDDADDLKVKGWTNWYANSNSIRKYGSYETHIADSRYYTSKKAASTDGSQTKVLDGDNNIIMDQDDIAAQEVMYHDTPLTDWSKGSLASEYIEFTAYGAMMLADRILLSDGPFAYEIDYDTYDPWEFDRLPTNIQELRAVHPNSAYADIEYGQKVRVDQEIGRLIDVIRYQNDIYGGAPLLYPVKIDKNSRETVAGVDQVIGAFTRLKELAKLRNYELEHFRLRIRPDGGVIYEKMDMTPKYALYPAPRGLEIYGGKREPTWDARPEVVKIFKRGAEHIPRTMFGDGRLRIHESVRMREGADGAEFGKAKYSRQQLYADLEAANKRRVKKAKKK